MDPISLDVMSHPVKTSDGHVYDNESITKWFLISDTSPLTGLRVSQEIYPAVEHIKLLDQLREEFEWEGKRDTRHIMVQSDIFPHLDKVTTMQNQFLGKLLTHYLPAPQIVVIGMESTGKSTLLERVIGFAIFPKSIPGQSQLCTRCPIRVHLRRTRESEISTVSIFDRRLNKVVAGSVEYTPLDRINVVVRRMMDKLMADHPRSFVLSTMEVVVNVSQPYCPNLDVLDLPGIVAAKANAREEFDGDLHQASVKLVKDIIESDKKNSIFLLVRFSFVWFDCIILQLHSSDTDILGVQLMIAGFGLSNSCTHSSIGKIGARMWNREPNIRNLHEGGSL
jgi:hypothetical protein